MIEILRPIPVKVWMVVVALCEREPPLAQCALHRFESVCVAGKHLGTTSSTNFDTSFKKCRRRSTLNKYTQEVLDGLDNNDNDARPDH
jgi:hypothetical protein